MDKERSNVSEAFELLLEVLEEERRKVADSLSQVALTKGAEAAQQVLQRLSFLEELKTEIQRLYENWKNGRMVQHGSSSRGQVLIEPEVSENDPTAEWLSRIISKPKHQKVFGGMPGHAFRPHILKALAQLGGSAKEMEVLERVEEMVKPYLSSIDLEWLPIGNDYRWRKKARWERFKMKQEGLLREDSPRGIWELSEKGWQEARKLLEGET